MNKTDPAVDRRMGTEPEGGLLKMKTILKLFMLAVGAVASVAAQPRPAAAEALTVEKTVVLIRHGIRSPSSSERKLFEPITTEAWPKWSVADGALTDHGKEAANRIGEYYRQRYSGLLGAAGCDHAGDVFAWANSGSGRTVETAAALLKGAFPDCEMKVDHKDQEDVDPMFWSFGVGKTPLEPEQTKAAILDAMGGSIEAARKHYADVYKSADAVVPCCHVSICEITGLDPKCSFSDLPWYLKEGGDPEFYQIMGGAEMGQVISEQIRMAYTEGMPLDRIGWGKIANVEDVKNILEMHRLRYKFFEETPYVAAKGGSQLLKQILLSLADGTSVKTSLDRQGKFPEAKFTLLSGHDTNIANVGALIGVNWQPRDYPENDTGPLGALVFDRLSEAGTGREFLRLSYVTPGMDAVRNGLPFTDPANIEAMELDIPGCADKVGKACELSQAIGLLEAKIDRKSTWDNDE
jgi:4-phytase/acid phosphatase